MSEPSSVRLLIIGPPGAGKGTQASRIANRYQIPAISTGDIFRSNIQQATPLGQQVQAIIEKGELVPDSLTNDIVADRLTHEDTKPGFLLDGYPRTLDQVHALDTMLTSTQASLQAVLLLEADTDEVVHRLLQRAEFEGRADDTEEVIRHRQRVYADQTAPLISLFTDRGILLRVNGLGAVDEVTERIFFALSETIGR